MTCDHEKRIHLRPVVLTSWGVRRSHMDPLSEVDRYAVVACYACGERWTEGDTDRKAALQPAVSPEAPPTQEKE